MPELVLRSFRFHILLSKLLLVFLYNFLKNTMKKILSLLFLIIIFVSFSMTFAESCNFNGNITESLTWCAPTWAITSHNYSLTKGAREKVIRITNQIIVVGSVLSVGGIVFSAILYISALGDTEKVKKAKTSLQFAIAWFAVMLLSFPIVNAIINFIYWLK
jgi:hypothetical protein